MWVLNNRNDFLPAISERDAVELFLALLRGNTRIPCSIVKITRRLVWFYNLFRVKSVPATRRIKDTRLDGATD